VARNYLKEYERIENMDFDCATLSNCGTYTETSSVSSTGCTAGDCINGCWYPYDWTPPYWPAQPIVSPIVFGVTPTIDYDLLADKVADRIKGTKERTKEEIRKDINKLLLELEKAK
jgi:hypothetical protein